MKNIYFCGYRIANSRNSRYRTHNLAQQNDSLFFTNVEVLANNEYGSTTVTCYCSYNNCWFWNCNTVYHCNYPICEEVSSDEAFDKGQCTLYSM